MSELKPEGSVLGRWSRRKTQAMQPEGLEPDLLLTVDGELQHIEEPDVEEPTPPPSDEDMPALETLDEDSDYSGFLSPNVSEGLRKQALRKLFSSTIFNTVDGLDDYDEDFTSFEPLGDLVTCDMKHQLEMEAKRKEEAALERAEDEVADEEVADEEDENTEAKEDSELAAPTNDVDQEPTESTHALENECELAPELKDSENDTHLEENIQCPNRA